MNELVELKEIAIDVRARDGTWCTLPYPRHPHGCPNYPECVEGQPSLTQLEAIHPYAKWYAVIEEFGLKDFSERMKQQHPDWSDRQSRCVLYWQASVRKRLLRKMRYYAGKLVEDNPDLCGKPLDILHIPEASGVNVFATMNRVGIVLMKNPDLVRKIMFIGFRRESVGNAHPNLSSSIGR
jgi:hypothetical protein